MNLYTKEKTSHQYFITFLFLIIGTILLFLILEPKVASLIFPSKRQILRKQFLSQVRMSREIDVKSWWKFREFYSPGTYIYNPTGTDIPSPLVSLSQNFAFVPSLSFTSAQLISIGGLTRLSKLPSVKIENTDILMNAPTARLFLAKDGYVLMFIKPIVQMKKANGFLQHETAADNKAGNYWLSISIIKT